MTDKDQNGGPLLPQCGKLDCLFTIIVGAKGTKLFNRNLRLNHLTLLIYPDIIGLTGENHSRGAVTRGPVHTQEENKHFYGEGFISTPSRLGQDRMKCIYGSSGKRIAVCYNHHSVVHQIPCAARQG
jgi:hypothetical protein